MTIDEFKKNIAPYMRHGWVFMDDCDIWRCCMFNKKPFFFFFYWYVDGYQYCLEMFDIEPVDNWQESLIEVGK